MNDLDDLMAIQRIEMNEILYGPRRTYTRRERLVRRAHVYIDRIRDAWLVLTGRAYIGD
jgi:hypothetical protein